jgi:hypothetical protein
MAKPPDFRGYTPDQMQKMVEADKRRRETISDWKLTGHTWGAIALILLVIGLLAAIFVR